MNIRILSLPLVVLMMSCSSSQPLTSEQQLVNALSEEPISVSRVARLLEQSVETGKTDTQLDGLLALCSSSLQHGLDNNYCLQAADLALLSMKPQARFRALLMQRLMTKDSYIDAELVRLSQQLSINIDETSWDKPVRSHCTNQNQIEEFRALSCYLYGKQNADSDAIERAIELFDALNWQRNRADALFLLAKLNRQKSPNQSRLLAAQSALILNRLGADSQASAVRAWVKESGL